VNIADLRDPQTRKDLRQPFQLKPYSFYFEIPWLEQGAVTKAVCHEQTTVNDSHFKKFNKIARHFLALSLIAICACNEKFARCFSKAIILCG